MTTHRTWAWVGALALVVGCPGKESGSGAKSGEKSGAKSEAEAESKVDAKADAKADGGAAGTDTGTPKDTDRDTPTPTPTTTSTSTSTSTSTTGATSAAESGSDGGSGDGDGDGGRAEARGDPYAHLYWSFSDDSSSTVDITDATAGTGKDDDLWKLMEECEDCNGHDEFLDPKDPRLPSEYKVGDKWIVVDADGPHVGTVKGFGIEGGASEGHFYVVLVDFPGGKFPAGLSFPGDTPPNPKAALVENPKKVPAKRPRTRALLGPLSKALAVGLDAEGKKALKKHPLTAKSLSLYAPKMPGNATHIAAISIDVPAPDPEDEMGNYIAGLFLVRGDGSIEVLSKPSYGIDTIEVTHRVDLEGDGFEEVAFTSSYYEGSYSYLVHWDGTKPIIRALGGDGA